MRILKVSSAAAAPIEAFESVNAASVELGAGSGEAHVHCVYLGAGSKIGAHRTGFAQLWVVLDGAGWAAGEDGRRVALAAGQAAYFARGEIHSKGSDSGMTALMMQVTDLELREWEDK